MTNQFIISRMGTEAGESLERIVARKDAERAAGKIQIAQAGDYFARTAAQHHGQGAEKPDA